MSDNTTPTRWLVFENVDYEGMSFVDEFSSLDAILKVYMEQVLGYSSAEYVAYGVQGDNPLKIYRLITHFSYPKDIRGQRRQVAWMEGNAVVHIVKDEMLYDYDVPPPPGFRECWQPDKGWYLEPRDTPTLHNATGMLIATHVSDPL